MLLKSIDTDMEITHCLKKYIVKLKKKLIYFKKGIKTNIDIQSELIYFLAFYNNEKISNLHISQ